MASTTLAAHSVSLAAYLPSYTGLRGYYKARNAQIPEFRWLAVGQFEVSGYCSSVVALIAAACVGSDGTLIFTEREDHIRVSSDSGGLSIIAIVTMQSSLWLSLKNIQLSMLSK